jgi:uncharacterized membrane protein
METLHLIGSALSWAGSLLGIGRTKLVVALCIAGAAFLALAYQRASIKTNIRQQERIKSLVKTLEITKERQRHDARYLRMSGDVARRQLRKQWSR